MHYRVQLTEMKGDQMEFADLIGTKGKLQRLREGLTFFPEHRGDWLSMDARYVSDDGQTVKVRTKRGNTFTFEVQNEVPTLL
jgi:hypothetical protein